MKLPNNIKLQGLGLIYKDNLIISDLQLGYEQQLISKGVLVPKFQLKDITKKLDSLLNKNIKRVIINGDIKHEFGYINKQEWNETLELFDYLNKKVKEIILIKGNHDIILDPIARKRNLKVQDSWSDKDVLVIHGHKIPKALKKTIIIGHEHPAISFPEKPHEKFKCFLLGTYKKSNLIVMPSFNEITTGSDIRTSKTLSPFIKNFNNFNCFIVSDNSEVKHFGKVKDISNL